MNDRFRSIQDSVSRPGSVKPNRETHLEKGDFKALMIAAWSTLGKTALLTMLFFAAVIALLVLIWTH